MVPVLIPSLTSAVLKDIEDARSKGFKGEQLQVWLQIGISILKGHARHCT